MTTWWLFSLSADLLDRKIQVIGSWKLKQHSVIFTKSTRYCACLNEIIPNWSGIEICWQRAKKWKMERRNSQGLDKVIHVYPTNLAFSNNVFPRYAGWIRAFWRRYLTKFEMVWSARVMDANWRYKGNIQETYTTAKSWNWFI